MSVFHPELRRAARFLPRITFTPRFTRFLKALQARRGASRPPPAADGVTIRDVMVPGVGDEPPVRVRLYWPQAASGPRPAILWIHGGGFIIGTPEQDENQLVTLCRDLGIVVAAVAYRLSPEHPYPAPMDDAYRALRWMRDQEGVSPDRIAIGGNSAGGGLAAGLVQRAHDLGEIKVAFQLLVYPMLDDRTVLRSDIDASRLRLWNNRSNRFGWTSYLGAEPGGANPPAYAVPARRSDLAGLPPAWIGVGTCDLFHDEDVDYARRLREAGVACALKVVPGAFHAFDRVRGDAAVTREFVGDYRTALREALAAPGAAGV
jgi:acetyl esterase/lipase